MFSLLNGNNRWHDLLLVNTGWGLIAACLLLILAVVVYPRIQFKASIVALTFVIAAGYLCWRNLATGDVAANGLSISRQIGLGILSVGIINAWLATPLHIHQSNDLRTKAIAFLLAQIFPVVGMLFIVGTNSATGMIVGLELVGWGLFFELGRRPSVMLQYQRRLLLQNFLGISLIVIGFAFGAHANLAVNRLSSLAMLLVVVGVMWRCWLVPLLFLWPRSESVSTDPMTSGAVFWPAMCLCFSLAKFSFGTPQAVGDVMHVVMIVFASGLLVTSAILIGMAASFSGLTRGLCNLIIGHATWAVALVFWEYDSPGRNLILLQDWPSAMPVLLMLLATWVLGMIGMSVCLRYIRHQNQSQNDFFADATGLYADRPLLAIVLMLSLFSLAGLPMTPGFWSRLALFVTSLSTELQSSLTEVYRPHTAFLALTIVGAVAGVVATLTVFKIAVTVVLAPPLRRFRTAQLSMANRVVSLGIIAAIGLLLLMFGTVPSVILEWFFSPTI